MTPPPMSAETISEVGEAIEAAARVAERTCERWRTAFPDDMARIKDSIAAAIRALTARVAVAPEAADPAVEVREVDKSLIRNIVSLAVLDGESIGAWRNERDPKVTIEIRVASVDGRTEQVLAALARSVGPDLRGVVEKCREKAWEAGIISTNHGGWFENDPWEWGQMMGRLVNEIADLCDRALGEAR